LLPVFRDCKYSNSNIFTKIILHVLKVIYTHMIDAHEHCLEYQLYSF